MDDKTKLFIAELLNEGVSLSNIQKRLHSEMGSKITFLELRLLASELEQVDWTKQKADVEAAAAEKKAAEEKAKAEKAKAADCNADGKTVVELSKLKRPGAVASGSVKFGSGATADWILDQTGRLGLENNVGKPNETDVQEFQEELQKMLAGGAL
jgi:membrane protein involved in colicin uptake